MRMYPKIRRLRPEDGEALVALRREALESHPLAFGSAVGEDRGLSLELVRASLADPDEQAVFGCFEGDHLAGMVGVRRDSGVKRRHRTYIWGMYVAPGARGKGAGRALLEAAVEQARAWPGIGQVRLSVTDPAIAAWKLYESVGFQAWGREPRALQWEGRFVDEIHLVLGLCRWALRPLP
jgi:ribosomal protein S18 acetylase RimI-like enzyme